MLIHTASLSAASVVGDQKVAILLYPKFEIVQATFWNTNNGGKLQIANLCESSKINSKSEIPNSNLLVVSAESLPDCISKTG